MAGGRLGLPCARSPATAIDETRMAPSARTTRPESHMSVSPGNDDPCHHIIAPLTDPVEFGLTGLPELHREISRMQILYRANAASARNPLTRRRCVSTRLLRRLHTTQTVQNGPEARVAAKGLEARIHRNRIEPRVALFAGGLELGERRVVIAEGRLQQRHVIGGYELP